MANIWPVYEGKNVTIGEPWASLSVSEAVALFELRSADRVSDIEKTPRFGATDRDLTFAGYKHIVVEVKRTESRGTDFRPGFYKSRIKPKEAFVKLIQQVLVAELGENNVLRVNAEPTTDSQGQETLRVAVVITPGATKRLKGEALIGILARLGERLSEMGEVRIPIIEYATEEELRQDAGS